MEYFEETVTISVELESLFSSLKVRSLKMSLLLTLPRKQVIVKNVVQAVILIPLEVLQLPVLLLSQNLCLLAHVQTLPHSVDPAGELKFLRD